MTGGAARVRTVSVRLRRVAPGRRAVQRLLVLGGLLIAGWLLGCAAQSASAHADELPAPAQVVARTPVLGEAAAAAHRREPVHRVVLAVAGRVPRTEPDKAPPQVAPPSQTVEPAGPMGKKPLPTAERPVAQARHLGVPRASSVLPARSVKGPLTRSAVGHVPPHVVRHPAMPAPQRHGDHSAAGGFVVNGATAGFPNVGDWAPAPPRASVPRVSGAIPPAVRTAADEPSFAPD